VHPLQPNPDHRRDILVLLFSIPGMLGLLARSAYLAVTGILSYDPGTVTGLAGSMLDALSMLFCAALFLPVLVTTLKRLKGKEILPATIRPVKFWQVALLAATWVVVVIAGAVLASLYTYGWAVAAPLFLLGISLPILSLAWVGAGGLPCGSRRRLWSSFGFGMVGGTFTALLLEYLVVGITIVIMGILAMMNPELRTIIDQIKTQVANAKAGDLQALLTGLAPTITNPLVILSILVFAAVLTPLIEEAVKPAIIWFLGKHLHSPAEGFVMGALCGAGFAMMEGLLAASSATQMWGFGLAGRAAASLMHITSSGVLGWGIASFQLEKRYGRLALTYLLSVGMHGLWNASAVMALYGALRMMLQNMQVELPGVLSMLGGLGMLVLELFLMVTALPLINRLLRRSIGSASVPPQVQSDIIAPLANSTSRETDGLDS